MQNQIREYYWNECFFQLLRLIKSEVEKDFNRDGLWKSHLEIVVLDNELSSYHRNPSLEGHQKAIEPYLPLMELNRPGSLLPNPERFPISISLGYSPGKSESVASESLYSEQDIPSLFLT
ncbi:unnamed protein product [Lepeophtheirus salmonis]|uniref:(salmon louse) hypothetical protein n=1 Tax=Lepeophtheirus salmonis TaxID=72036 RepID=A0A7R8CI02_LEPSM|nr:unnamed protein product [Lepeophtheirus salmonis]CAF2823317.1 unnamed protein product [Lepeophtheirus salmonis]